MKVVIGCLLSAFLAGFYCNLYAQSQPATVQGKVLFQDHSPAAAATIILLKSGDSSVVKSVIADKTGVFRLTGVPPDKYLLLVTIIGYTKSYYGPYQVNKGQTVNLPEIKLTLSPKQLKTATVLGTRPAIEVTPGKMTVNVQSMITAAGSSAYEILRQAPNVRVDNNNNISIIGRQSALVLIDGKPTNLAGEDLAEMLRGIQASTIDRIELVTSGSAKYDASSGGVINIFLKKGANVGANGTVTGSLGYGKYDKESAGIIFNDHAKQFNIFGNYNYSFNKTFRNIVTNRVINYNNVVSNYNTNYNNIQKDYNNTFSLGTDYFISSNHTIGFLVNGFVTDDGFVKNNDLKIFNQAIFDSTITANSDLNRHVTRVNYNLNYNGRLDGRGKTLSADVNYTTYNRSSSEYITNDFFNASGSEYRAPQLLQNLSPSNIKIWLSKVDFTDPLSKTSKLETGIKYSYVTSNNDLMFGPLVNGRYQNDPRFSNHFLYTENVNAAYVNYENRFRKFDLAASLRAEQTIAKGNSITLGRVVNNSYLDFFPQALLTYKYDDKREFSISYSRGIARPAYEDVNPFLYYIDPYDYRSGNPYLKPQYSDNIELSYNYKKAFLVTLYSLTIHNAYDLNFFEQNDASKVNITIRKNLGTIYNYGLKFFAPVRFTGWWNGNFSIDAAYQRYVAYPVNGNLNKGTPDINFSSTQQFIISNTLSAELSGKYESPNFYGISQFKTNYRVDAGLSKQLFNKRASLKLSGADIFNTLRDRSQTNYQNLNISIMDKKESQVARLTFTYRFGRSSVKDASIHNTGNEEEQKRTRSSN
ncbi:MAG TPA: TonB-dependent receptor [Mucilaginibacter sp.]|jgi:iron complex outermembrane receptor protein|nr:TonB-dependent receptor [Mucilaginibacter sp.]